MKPLIEVQEIWKQYRFGTDRRYKSIRDSILKLPGMFNREEKDYFWALQDISFTLSHGQSLGIIGYNGAGKSTLLKLLSGITIPSKGKIILRGKVGSLLEVGSGLHPELTGRENIFFYGSVLGMPYRDIKSRFDEIVAFSGVESFIDTALKHYSTGMQLRLGFSVAAFLETDIMLIDEMLAVGDAAFQQKCIHKMNELCQSGGRSLIFVSHNLNMVAGLCPASILLKSGKMHAFGPTDKIITNYLSDLSQPDHIFQSGIQEGSNALEIKSIELTDAKGQIKYMFYRNEKIGIKIHYHVKASGLTIRSGINLYNFEGYNLFDSHNVLSPYYNEQHPMGEYVQTAWIPGLLLRDGNYFVGYGFFNHQQNKVYAKAKQAASFQVILDDDDVLKKVIDPIPGLIAPEIIWKNE
jgi:lipopolysaccharide transport system ATP-binding protein